MGGGFPVGEVGVVVMVDTVAADILVVTEEAEVVGEVAGQRTDIMLVAAAAGFVIIAAELVIWPEIVTRGVVAGDEDTVVVDTLVVLPVVHAITVERRGILQGTALMGRSDNVGLPL